MTRKKKVLLIVAGAAMLSAAAWCALSANRYDALIQEEIRLLVAEGGSRDIRDLVVRLEPGEPDAGPLVVKAGGVTVEARAAIFEAMRAEDDNISLLAADSIYRDFTQWYSERFFAGAMRTAPRKWNDEWMPHLEAVAEANSEALLLAKEAARIGRADFSSHWETVPAPVSLHYTTPGSVKTHYTTLRDLARWLAVDAAVALEKGDMDAACESVYTAMRLGALLDGEPTVVANLVAMAMNSLSLPSVQMLLEKGFRDREGLESLIDLVQNRDERGAMQRALLGETALGIGFFGLVRKDPGALWTMSATPKQHPLKRMFFNTAFGLLWNSTADEYNYLRGMREVRRWMRLPFHEVVNNTPAQAPAGLLKSPSRRITDRLLPMYREVNVHVTRNAARTSVAVTVLALRLYDIDHGGFPETLDALVPEYLDSVPLDPFDGKPLRYVKKDGAAVVYSVGDDATDNGGVYLGWGALGGDIPWVLGSLETETEKTE